MAHPRMTVSMSQLPLSSCLPLQYDIIWRPTLLMARASCVLKSFSWPLRSAVTMWV
jgi:hypothetical protein